MIYVNSLIYVSAIAYLTALFLPKPATKNIPFWIEKIMYLASGLLLLLNLTFNIHMLWLIMSVIWTVYSGMSYLGYVEWNILWKKKTSDAAQIFMSTWDLAIAFCCMIKFL
jgi:hypothetical protein